jgi:phage protein D
LADNSTFIPGSPSVENYAPNFKVFVEGYELDAETHGDMLDVKVTMGIDEPTHFDLTINNWDDKSFNFKHSDNKTFNVGNILSVQIGYADDLKFVAKGIISSMTPRFPESGPPTLSVSGLDERMSLRHNKPGEDQIKRFVDKKHWEIAGIVAQRNHLQIEATEEGAVQPLVMQGDRDELTFLLQLAKEIDFDVYVRIDPKTGEGKLYFVKPTDNRDGSRSREFLFEWGQSLISFSPQISLISQVDSVTVRGWSPVTKQAISYTATQHDLPKTGGDGADGAQMAADRLKRKDVIVDQPVFSEEEARVRAVSELRARAYEFLTGSGQVIGMPDLRPGDNLELRGLGKRFSGTREKPLKYQIRKVTHSIGGSGFITEFEVRSVKDGGQANGAANSAGGTR